MSKNTILSALFITSSVLFASPNVVAMEAQDFFTHCGIGGALFKENKTFAAMSNVTWDSGTTAITSGLSESGCNEVEVEAASLVYKNYARIEAETVSGSGQNLAALMSIYQCDSASQKVVLRGVRQDFSAQLEASNDYNSASQLDKAQNYFSILDQNVKSSCVI